MNHITPWHERPEVLAIDEEKDWTPDSQDSVDKAKADEIAELRAALVQPAQPDCRTCANFCNGLSISHECDARPKCTNGDQYEPAPRVVLWRMK